MVSPSFLRYAKVFVIGSVAGVLGTVVLGVAVWSMSGDAGTEHRHRPDGPTLVEKVREVARLETLEVRTHKTLSYEADPPASHTLLQSVRNWARYTTDPPIGRAIVFADVHVGLDFSRFDERSIRVQDDVVTVVLPSLVTRVEIRPGETEVISSNLDTAGSAELLDRAKWAIEADVQRDETLAARARASARRALTGFLMAAGFREVVFVEDLGPEPVPSPAPAA